MPFKRVIYWDACVWIAWLWNEARPNNEMDGVLESSQEIMRGEALLLASDVLNAEVQQTTLSEEAQRRFYRISDRRNVQFQRIDPRVGALSMEIKKHYRDLNKQDRKGEVTESDATHLATAIHFKADAFYTFDDGQKGRSRSLLSLDGNVAGYNLKVCKPPITQHRIHFS
jgi:predicted nucleic acid-binding protein